MDYEWSFKNGWIFFKKQGQIVPYAMRFSTLAATKETKPGLVNKPIVQVAKSIEKSPVFLDLIDSVLLVDML